MSHDMTNKQDGMCALRHKLAPCGQPRLWSDLADALMILSCRGSFISSGIKSRSNSRQFQKFISLYIFRCFKVCESDKKDKRKNSYSPDWKINIKRWQTDLKLKSHFWLLYMQLWGHTFQPVAVYDSYASCTSKSYTLFIKLLVGWLFWVIQSFETVFLSISGRLPRRGRKSPRREKILSKQLSPAPTASAIGPSPTIIKLVGRPGTESFQAPSPESTTH